MIETPPLNNPTKNPTTTENTHLWPQAEDDHGQHALNGIATPGGDAQQLPSLAVEVVVKVEV